MGRPVCYTFCCKQKCVWCLLSGKFFVRRTSHNLQCPKVFLIECKKRQLYPTLQNITFCFIFYTVSYCADSVEKHRIIDLFSASAKKKKKSLQCLTNQKFQSVRGNSDLRAIIVVFCSCNRLMIELEEDYQDSK